MNFFWQFFVLCCFAGNIQARVAITKLWHHRGSAVDQIVCYANRKPQISVTTLSRKRNDRTLTEKTIFLPGTQLATEAAQLAAGQINERTDPTYRVSVHELNDGVQLKFLYDPQLTTVGPHMFKAITGDLGVACLVNTPRKRRSVRRECAFVVLDYGHGGSDKGAVGLNGVTEKSLTMAIGKHVKKLLNNEGIQVHETRTRDEFVPLDARTSDANRYLGDIFVSLHINAAPHKEAKGIETFYNSTQSYVPASEKFNKKEVASQKLASEIQRSVLGACSNYDVVDRKAKPTVSQVLMGTEMPSALIELGFCSNPVECKRLSNAEYQKQLAAGVAKGIVAYLSAS